MAGARHERTLFPVGSSALLARPRLVVLRTLLLYEPKTGSFSFYFRLLYDSER